VVVDTGTVGFFVAAGFGVFNATAALVGVSAGTVTAGLLVGSGVIEGAVGVSVSGGGVAVTMTVI
jgi:hypothetical protein